MPKSHLKSTPAETVILAESAYPVSIDRVWRAWTDPARLSKWFGQQPNSLKSAEVDLREGGAWRFIFSEPGEPYAALEGAYTEVSEPDRLAFSWRHVSKDADGQETATPYSEVVVTMQSTEGGTRVQIRHSNIQTIEGRTGVSAGWDTSLASLGAMLEEEALAAA